MKHRDKLIHMVIGLLVTFVFGVMDPLVGFSACLLVAWLKEEHDRTRSLAHTRDGWDAYATVFGALPGMLLLRTPLPDMILQLVM